MTWRACARPIAGVAAAQVGVGLAGALLVALSPAPATALDAPWSLLLALLAFAGAGGCLLQGARSDDRATFLGTTFLLVATSFASRGLIEASERGPDALRIVAMVLRPLRVDAFTPLFLWLFACRFPRTLSSPRSARVGVLGVSVSLLAGISIFCLEAARQQQLFGLRIVLLDNLSPEGVRGLAWPILYALAGATLPLMILRARRARPEERRRVALFVAAIVIGSIAPAAIVVLAPLSSTVHDVFVGPTSWPWAVPVVRIFVAAVPIATAYTVLAERVLSVRILLRYALRYSLARSTIFIVSVIPVVWLLTYLYDARDERLADLVTGRRALGLLLIGGVIFATLRLRLTALRALDRLFFREQYEAHRILSAFASRSRSLSSGSTRDMAISFATEIDRALHLDRVDVMPVDPLRREIFSPRGLAPALGFDSVLARQMTRSTGPLLVDLELGGEIIDSLPESERQWLATAGFRLVVPMLGSAGDLIGCIGLGMKKSEADWSRDDFELLETAATAAGLALENQVLRGSGRDSRTSGGIVPASECRVCRRVVAASEEKCPVCATELTPSLLPAVLFGKFRLETRIGTGAMGVVFRATDLDLDRLVAIKTLPRLSPQNALRLRREARTLATISHAHLATIYGAETWQDIPLLVLEYLAGGTLEARIRERPLSEHDAIALGIAMADVLDRLHAAGLLHRDIKPSNVAYTDDGVPKLLDFDLARILSETAAVPAVDATAPEADPAVPGRSLGSYSGVAGTPLYMSPEALYGTAPDISFDLWGASVTLYEAVTGTHPFVAASWGASMARISDASCRDVREGAPGCSERFAAFFRDALARDPRRRPSSARDMRRRLLECAA